MSDARVMELSDGEEMVVDAVTLRFLSDDPRERAIEARRKAFDNDEPSDERSCWAR